MAQFFGWQWGKSVAPVEAPRFHAVLLGSVIGAVVVGLTTIDPIKLTEYLLVISAAAIPMTYLPLLIVANDPDYLGERYVNGPVRNTIATAYLVLVIVLAIAALPLMIATKGGQ